jgi:hypothetical protein
MQAREPCATAWCRIGMTTNCLDVWYSRNILSRLSVVLFAALTAYAIYVASFVLARLHSLSAAHENESLHASLSRLGNRAANLQQSIAGIFYFFGLAFFVQTKYSFWTPESRTRGVGVMVLDNFQRYFGYAAVAFLALLILHSIQWFVSARVRKSARVGVSLMD